MLEHSETSDNRPFLTSDTNPETTPEEQTSNFEPLYTRQQSEQSEQEALANLFQNSDHLKNNHYTHHYHKSQIYNNQILLKQLQFTIHQKSLKKLYKIHEVSQ